MSDAIKLKCDAVYSSVKPVFDPDALSYDIKLLVKEFHGVRLFCLGAYHGHPDIIKKIKKVLDAFYASQKQHLIMLDEGIEYGDNRNPDFPECAALQKTVALLSKDPGVIVEQHPATVSVMTDTVVDILATNAPEKFTVEKQLFHRIINDINDLFVIAFQHKSNTPGAEFKKLIKEYLETHGLSHPLDGRFEKLDSGAKNRLHRQLNAAVDNMVDNFLTDEAFFSGKEVYDKHYWAAYGREAWEYCDVACEISNTVSVEKIYTPLAKRLAEMAVRGEAVDVLVHFGQGHMECFDLLISMLTKQLPEYLLSSKEELHDMAVINYLNQSSALGFFGVKRKSQGAETLEDYTADAVAKIDDPEKLEVAVSLQEVLGSGSMHKASGKQPGLFVLHGVNVTESAEMVDKIRALPVLGAFKA